MKGVKKKIIRNNSALAGVIEALLLVGLVAIILSTIQLVYIPEIMKQKENDHVDEVENQFSHLKSVIETQSMLGVINSGETIAHSPISSPITLGSDRLPYFVSSQTRGSVKIVDKDAAGENKIDILPAVGEYIDGIPLTSVIYQMDSMYLNYDIEYVLEGGGIILNQSGVDIDTGEVTRVNPAITIDNLSSSIKINYYVPVFDCVPGKNTTPWAIDPAYIRTNYTNHVTHFDTSISSINIYSDYLEGWNNCLLEDDRGFLWEYNENGAINVEYDNPSNPSYISITPNDKTIDIDFTIVEIGIQTGTGTVIG